jgi:hypothetical protein
MGAFAAYVPVLASVEDEVAECFRTGGGVPYASYPRLQEVMAEDTGPVFDATLIDTRFPSFQTSWIGCATEWTPPTSAVAPATQRWPIRATRGSGSLQRRC